jgi:hypothetical protein
LRPRKCHSHPEKERDIPLKSTTSLQAQQPVKDVDHARSRYTGQLFTQSAVTNLSMSVRRRVSHMQRLSQSQYSVHNCRSIGPKTLHSRVSSRDCLDVKRCSLESCFREVFALEQKLKDLQERAAAIDTSVAVQDDPLFSRQATVGRIAHPPDVGRYVGQDTGVRFALTIIQDIS